MNIIFEILKLNVVLFLLAYVMRIRRKPFYRLTGGDSKKQKEKESTNGFSRSDVRVLHSNGFTYGRRLFEGSWRSGQGARRHQDRKSTRLNSSHVAISYAVFCLKKKK